MNERLLEEALQELAQKVESMEALITLRPSHLIVPPVVYRTLMWRSPIRKAKGIRGRKRALYWRTKPLMWDLMKEAKKHE